MRAIFIPVAARPECEAALQTTFAMARRLGSDVIGCHIQPPIVDPTDWSMADVWAMNSAQSWPVQTEAEHAAAALAARELFESLAKSQGYGISEQAGTREQPRAHWETRIGLPPDLMPMIGAASDLIVVSRPPERGGHKAWQLMMGALLESSRPVLILPQEPTSMSGRRLALAWNRGRMETCLLHAALPLLKAADDVVFLTAGHEKKRGPSLDDMLRYLALQGISARARSLNRADAGPALIEAAQAEGADLLLAGAYTRGRLKEVVFGGVTEYLVTKTKFPVLMMHA